MSTVNARGTEAFLARFEHLGERLPGDAKARDAAAAGLVDIRTLAPDIALDMRYAGADNFTGRRVPGYDAPTCYLLAPAANALAAVEAELHADGYALRVFDCYRPVQAVRAFVEL